MKAAIVAISGPVLTALEAALLRRHQPAGVILFARNIQDREQLSGLMRDLRAVLLPEAVLLVDQEGGRVARLRSPLWRRHPPAARLGSERAAWLSGALIGLDCAAAGFDVACAPVLDVQHPGAHDVIGDRAFASDPDRVVLLASAFADGLLAAGIQPVGKHVPGHGRSLVDSHLELPRVTARACELEADLRPFTALSHLPWMMTAHICYAAWDANRPATLSPIVINDIIRGRIGFDGVLVTDDLAMRALNGPPGELARAALAAGCDIALHCSGVMEESEDALAATPDLTPRAADRLAAARALVRARHLRLDAAALETERAALLAPTAV